MQFRPSAKISALSSQTLTAKGVLPERLVKKAATIKRFYSVRQRIKSTD